MLLEGNTKDICNGCTDCICEKTENLEAMHHHHQNHCNNIIHVGPEGCMESVPIMEFAGFGRAYIPHQKLCQIYKANVGFVRGTIFPELDFPYEPRDFFSHEAKGGEDHA